jgi:hypothetical protein
VSSADTQKYRDRKAEVWDGLAGALASEAVSLVAELVDDIRAPAARLLQLAENWDVDRITALTAARWRLAGYLDACPDDRLALAAMGLVGYAALIDAPATSPRATEPATPPADCYAYSAPPGRAVQADLHALFDEQVVAGGGRRRLPRLGGI